MKAENGSLRRRIRWARYARRVGKNVLLAVLAVLALAALIRMLAALVEALALLLLALTATVLVLPHNLGWYWRQLRREAPQWLHMAAQWLSMPAPSAPGAKTRNAEKG